LGVIQQHSRNIQFSNCWGKEYGLIAFPILAVTIGDTEKRTVNHRPPGESVQ
jgi:hypothetical protein